MKTYHWAPTPSQELLLRSALSEPGDACRCWTAWRQANDIEKLDRGSYRLLPMVYKNLGSLVPLKDEWHEKLQGTYKKSWFGNHMIQETAAALFRELKKTGVRPLLLKGLHLVNSYYDDLASRPLGDADFLVSWEQAPFVDRHMRASGWKLKDRPRFPVFAENSMSAGIGINYVNEKGYICDLHWNVLSHRCYPGANREMIRNAVTITFKGDCYSAFCPENLILHLLEHGAYANPIPSIRWVPDVLMVLKKEKSIDWDRFLANTLRTALEVPAGAMLEYLLNTFRAGEVAYAVQKLAARPASEAGKALYRNMLPRRTPLGRSSSDYRRIYSRYRMYMTEFKQEPLPRGIRGWSECLKFRWGVKSDLLFPLVFMKKFFHKFIPYFLGQLKPTPKIRGRS